LVGLLSFLLSVLTHGSIVGQVWLHTNGGELLLEAVDWLYGVRLIFVLGVALLAVLGSVIYAASRARAESSGRKLISAALREMGEACIAFFATSLERVVLVLLRCLRAGLMLAGSWVIGLLVKVMIVESTTLWDSSKFDVYPLVEWLKFVGRGAAIMVLLVMVVGVACLPTWKSLSRTTNDNVNGHISFFKRVLRVFGDGWDYGDARRGCGRAIYFEFWVLVSLWAGCAIGLLINMLSRGSLGEHGMGLLFVVSTIVVIGSVIVFGVRRSGRE
jgi:hypothetical protein